MSQTNNFPYKEQMMGLMQEISGQMYIPQLVQHFDKSMIYSTDEKLVGCWIDGRPIYQKTVDLGGLTDTGNTQPSKYVEIGASVNEYIDYQILCNVESGANIVWQGGVSYIADKGDSAITPSLHTNHSSDSSLKNKVGVIYLGNLSWVNNVRMTLRYTKTTDADGSFNLADENDYSTTEKIVGTWIDGKPVYQKVISGSLGNTTTTSIAHGVSNLSKWIKINGMAYFGANDACPVPYPTEGDSATVQLRSNGNNIEVQTYTNWSGATIYIILQYTKTTD